MKLKSLVRVNNRIVRTNSTRLLYYIVSLQELISLFMFILLMFKLNIR